jgi:hypothetical protein
MKINYNYHIAKRITRVSQKISYNGMAYDVENEYHNGYEIETQRLYM